MGRYWGLRFQTEKKEAKQNKSKNKNKTKKITNTHTHTHPHTKESKHEICVYISLNYTNVKSNSVKLTYHRFSSTNNEALSNGEVRLS